MNMEKLIATLRNAARYLLQDGMRAEGLAVQACVTMLQDDSADDVPPPTAFEWLRIHQPDQYRKWQAGDLEPAVVDWIAGWEACRTAMTDAVVPVSERRPLGCALAARVMQSDLYPMLEDSERADCDELVQQNLEWVKRDNARGVMVDAAPRYHCKKCGYVGIPGDAAPLHQRPNGSGECGYMAVPMKTAAGVTPSDSKTKGKE